MKKCVCVGGGVFLFSDSNCLCISKGKSMEVTFASQMFMCRVMDYVAAYNMQLM